MEFIATSTILAFIVVIMVNVPFLSIKFTTALGNWVGGMVNKVGVWYISVPTILSLLFCVGMTYYDWVGSLAGTVVAIAAYAIPAVRRQLLAASLAYSKAALTAR